MANFNFTDRSRFIDNYFSAYNINKSGDVISDNKPQLIGDGVSITGYGLNGSVKPLAFSSQFAEPGLGIADNSARWNGQIDYYWDHKVHGQKVSERLVIDFGGTVQNFVLTVGMLGATEGRGANSTRPPETGEWYAYDSNDGLLGSGLINPAKSSRRKRGGVWRIPVQDRCWSTDCQARIRSSTVRLSKCRKNRPRRY